MKVLKIDNNNNKTSFTNKSKELSTFYKNIKAFKNGELSRNEYIASFNKDIIAFTKDRAAYNKLNPAEKNYINDIRTTIELSDKKRVSAQYLYEKIAELLNKK